MKKFLLLISAWLSLHASAQIESTRYGFTNTANNTANGEYTQITLPTYFSMSGWGGIVLYEDAKGFKLTKETSRIKFNWSEYTNGETRLAFTYTAKWTENGENKTIEQKGREEWMPMSVHTDFNLYETGANSENGIATILAADPDAEIIITKIRLNNFNFNEGGTINYGLDGLNIGGQDITTLASNPDNIGVTLYGGEFTVKNYGAQACNIARFDIPEQYRGQYVRIDFGAEPDHVWGLNLAFEKAPGEGCGGWMDINGYTKKIGLSRYYKIPEEAISMNPQIWKNTEGDENPWTINVTGLYLTTGFDMSSVYTDEYFPLSAEDMNLTLWGNNSFDDNTKTITFGGSYAQAGWNNTAKANYHTQYKYLVAAANPQANAYVTLNFRINENNLDCKVVKETGEDNCFNNGKNYVVVDFNSDLLQYTINKDGSDQTVKVSFKDITSINDFHFWQSWEEEYELPLANVFLTNVEPNWATPETRTTQAGNYGTVCLPYPAVCTNGYVYTISGKDTDGITLYLEPYNGVMRPGMPYIYKSIGDGVKFYPIEDEEAKATEASAHNGLVGCWGTATANESCYALNSDNKWYKMDKDVTFANRAYLDLSSVPVIEEEQPVANVAMRVIPGTTGIDAVQQDKTADDQAVYTLSGIRVDDGVKLGKGIYIRGEKKFIVK